MVFCYVVEYIMGEPERWRADLLGNFLSLKEILERNLGKKLDQEGGTKTESKSNTCIWQEILERNLGKKSDQEGVKI